MKWVVETTIFKSLTFFMLAVALSACDRTPPEAKWVAALMTQIGGDYLELMAASKSMADSVDSYCANPNDLAQPRAEWRQTMAAWQHVQWVRFGPVVDNNDDWKIQFWPDKKNIVARKVNQLLARQEPVDTAAVASASVVVQGLSALELLMFDPQYSQQFSTDNPVADKHCQLLVATSKHLVSTISNIYQQWEQPKFQARWLGSIVDPESTMHVDAETEAVGAMLSQMEKVKLDKLGGPLGYKNRNRQPNGYFAEGWRSHTSLANIKTNLLSIKVLIDNQGEYDLRRLLAAKGNDELADKIQTQINMCLSLVSAIDIPLSLAVMDVAHKQQLEALHQAVGELNSLLKSGLSSALDIKLGFNSNDGD